MYDEPGRGQPDMDACLLARTLIDDFGLTCRDAAERLTEQGYGCKSPETARRWRDRGRAEWERIESQAMDAERERRAKVRRNQHALREVTRAYHAGLLTAAQWSQEIDRCERRGNTLYGLDVQRVEHSGRIGLPAPDPVADGAAFGPAPGVP